MPQLSGDRFEGSDQAPAPSPATAVTTQAFGDAPVVGSLFRFAHEEHKHGMPILDEFTAGAPRTTTSMGATKRLFNGFVLSSGLDVRYIIVPMFRALVGTVGGTFGLYDQAEQKIVTAEKTEAGVAAGTRRGIRADLGAVYRLTPGRYYLCYQGIDVNQSYFFDVGISQMTPHPEWWLTWRGGIYDAAYADAWPAAIPAAAKGPPGGMNLPFGMYARLSKLGL
jgi:hypothetical protein